MVSRLITSHSKGQITVGFCSFVAYLTNYYLPLSEALGVNMDCEFFIKLFVTALIAVLGWIVAHWFSSKREATAKKRDITTEYLINSFSEIERAIEPHEITKDWFINLASALHKIQLLGSEKQIELVHQIFEAMKEDKAIFPNDILKDLMSILRDDLRGKLELKRVNSKVTLLRLGEKVTPNKKLNKD